MYFKIKLDSMDVILSVQHLNIYFFNFRGVDSLIFIYFGEFDTARTNEPLPRITRFANKVFLHPKYIKESIFYNGNDIALL